MRNRAPRRHLEPPLFLTLFGALSVLTVLPFWMFRYPVLADYPQHLARWFVLYQIHNPAFRFSGYYTPDWGPHPYVLVDVLGVWLQHILAIDIAGRCVITICVLSVPLATLFYLRKAAPGNDSLALFGFLIALNPLLLMGFLEYELSFGLCIFVIGLWVSYCESPKLLTALGIVLGIFLVYLTHVIGFALLGLATGFYSLTLKRPLKRLVDLGLFALPTLTLFAFNMRRLLGDGRLSYEGMTAWGKFRNLAQPFRIYSRLEDLVLLAGLAAVVFLLFQHRKQIQWQKSWIIVCVLLLIVYLLAPGNYGMGGYLDVRVMPLVCVLALASVKIRKIPRILTVLVVLTVLFRCGTVGMLFASKQHSLEERTLAFQAIPAGSRVLPFFRFDPDVPLVSNASLHHIAYGVISRGFFLPTIAWLPSLQPLRVTGARYCPDAFCQVTNLENIDWEQVARYYDYLWVDTFPSAIPYADSMADRVLTNGTVFVYRVRRPTAFSSQAEVGH